ncbi:MULTISPECIES: arsenic transporter [unclassified Novosphingobium]|uniref:arsenic transporter n=1 Tax=unclassified Novosphingobium TaxID=2644732 RepID=UPI00146E5149|nr:MULTISPECIES: arsenic transporter [unclassified Novosphingobium]NMN04645.1 arsenical pump membrane protein [Novosphingobium sp. SG919]NMN85362.1 arsenical pump membrane protein [Novosphingobium sp. SG916]
MSSATGAIWAIASLSTAGVIARPMRWPEWIWAVSGAALLLVTGLMPLAAAGAAVAKGLDVYLFLTGMMLLSEAARQHGVFDWIAAAAVNHASGSRAWLFTLVYATGALVTVFLSNDATAVVLTPAVFAVARKARAEPLPLLFACALIANAASFVLPISNPANLVLYGGHMPPLGPWLAAFALPSIAAIGATYVALRWYFRRDLAGQCATVVERPALSRAGQAALLAIVLTAGVLIAASALDRPLGLPTALAGLACAIGVSLQARQSPLGLARHVAWGVLPLVAGLFVVVEAVARTGAIGAVANLLAQASAHPASAALASGTVLALVSNIMNNLPAGLVSASAVALAHPPRVIVDALLIGVDLGPNLSITGSLATILWLQVIRREGEDVGFATFLKVGLVAMPPALLLALLCRIIAG